MKRNALFFAAVAVMLFFVIGSCNKDDDPVTETKTGTLRLMIDNRALGLSGSMEDLVLDTFAYKTAEGDTISYDHVKYFISNVWLVNTTDCKTVPNIYILKKQDDSTTSYRTMVDITGFEIGTYDSLKFSVGVDNECNTVTACTYGDLDPFSSDPEKMIWDWATSSGYKFMRIEGNYKGNATGGSAIDGAYTFHIGSNSNYKTIALKGDPIKIEEGKTTMVHIMAMTNQIFDNPNTIDLEATPNHGSAGSANISANYATGMFMIHHVNDPL